MIEKQTLQEYLNPEGLPHMVSPQDLREVLAHPHLRRALVDAMEQIKEMCQINTLQLDGADNESIALQVKEKAGLQRGAATVLELVLKVANEEL